MSSDHSNPRPQDIGQDKDHQSPGESISILWSQAEDSLLKILKNFAINSIFKKNKQLKCPQAEFQSAIACSIFLALLCEIQFNYILFYCHFFMPTIVY